MKTKLFKTLAATAMSVLAIACAKEPVADNGQQAGVSFTVEVPGASVTKAYGEAEKATKLYYQVFDNTGAPIEGLGVQTTDLVGKAAKVNFQLVKDQTYNFVFWAQTTETGYYTIDATEGLKKITADYTTHKDANDENRDAFFATESFKVTGPVTKTVTLKRPFAQINIGTKDQLKAGAATAPAINFDGAKSSVTVKGVPTVFSPLATTPETMLTVPTDVTFASAAIPTGSLNVNGTDYNYLAMNYVFAPAEGTVCDLTAEIVLTGREPIQLSSPTTPIKRNWRTNILGSLLTSSADFDVVVDPNFEGEDNQAIVNSESEFAAALAKGGKVTLTQDLVTENYLNIKKENTEIIIAAGVTLTGDLSNSNKVLRYYDNVGHQVLSGEGTIVGPKTNNASSAAAIELEDKHNDLVINGNLTVKGGKGTVSGRTDAAIFIRAGKVTINGGHFISDLDADGGENPVIYMYSPFTYRSELVINGGTFESLSGNNKYLINKDDETTDHCTISIYGGTFIGFDPADNESNGPHTNYVASGYHSTKISTDPTTGISTYVVTKDDITPVVNQEGLATAVTTPNSTVKLEAGTYTLPSTVGDGVTIEGPADGSVVISVPTAVAYHDKDIAFKGVTVKSPNGNYIGIQHAASVKYENCVIEGQPFSYAKTAVYEGCTFEQTSNDAYNIWTYASADITFKDCIFNCAGKSVLIYNEGALESGKVTFNGCEFHASESVTGKAAIEIDSRFTSYVVRITDCTQNGFSNGSVSGNPLWNKKQGEKSVTIVVDGTQVL